MEVHQTIVVRNERHGLDMEDVLAAHLRNASIQLPGGLRQSRSCKRVEKREGMDDDALAFVQELQGRSVAVSLCFSNLHSNFWLLVFFGKL